MWRKVGWVLLGTIAFGAIGFAMLLLLAFALGDPIEGLPFDTLLRNRSSYAVVIRIEGDSERKRVNLLPGQTLRQRFSLSKSHILVVCQAESRAGEPDPQTSSVFAHATGTGLSTFLIDTEGVIHKDPKTSSDESSSPP